MGCPLPWSGLAIALALTCFLQHWPIGRGRRCFGTRCRTGRRCFSRCGFRRWADQSGSLHRWLGGSGFTLCGHCWGWLWCCYLSGSLHYRCRFARSRFNRADWLGPTLRTRGRPNWGNRTRGCRSGWGSNRAGGRYGWRRRLCRSRRLHLWPLGRFNGRTISPNFKDLLFFDGGLCTALSGLGHGGRA